MENEKQSSKEIWKDITGLEGRYKISNKGRVMSIKPGGNIIMKPYLKDGYYRINLRDNGKIVRKKIHRLVAKEFIDKPDLCINHKDLDKTNNTVENLEWVTSRENVIHYRSLLEFDLTDSDLQQLEDIIDAKRLQSAGLQLTEIAKILNKPTSTIHGWLRKNKKTQLLINKFDINIDGF